MYSSHQSDFAWKRSGKKFEQGEEVEFKVIVLDLEGRKVKGGIKQLQTSPWELFKGKYKVGDIVTKEIARIADFGLFIGLEDGVDGLIHTSQVSTEFVKTLSDKFKVGAEITAEIIEIDNAQERVKLSIKRYEMMQEKRENAELLAKYGTVGEE